MKPMVPSALWGTLAAPLLAGLVACGSDATGLLTVHAADADALPHGCAEWLVADDNTLMWAAVEGDAEAVVLDTPHGSCVDAWEHVIGLLDSQGRRAASGRAALAYAEASAHADLVGGELVMADPSPHPDKPQGTVSADPTPHPDRDRDEHEGEVAVFIVLHVGGPSGGGTPPPPPPP